MRQFILATFWVVISATPSCAENYTVIEEKDGSFGNVRSRVILEIEIPGAGSEREQLLAMMKAAVDRHRKDWPDAVSVRVWDDYGNDFSLARNGIDYAPDGCGWGGDKCTGEIWTDLLMGQIPEDLSEWGAPADEEEEAGEEKACRQNLQCWGDRHILQATITCQPLIESLARYDHEWTDGWFGSKMKRWLWNDRTAGTISYTGNEVKFQNGFENWIRVTYWCHYDPNSESATVSIFE